MIYLYRAPGFFGGDKKRAYPIPREIAAFNPARGHLAQAQIDLLEKRPDLARESYRKAVAADPNFQDARICSRAAWPVSPNGPKFRRAKPIRINPKRIDGWELLAYALGRQARSPNLTKPSPRWATLRACSMAPADFWMAPKTAPKPNRCCAST
jgi:hypothetical protein